MPSATPPRTGLQPIGEAGDSVERDIARVPTEDALERRRDTRPQVGLTADARVQNVAGAFAARRSLAGQSVLLIDDVLTTGSTLLDCARACRLAGASDVRALTLAVDDEPCERVIQLL